MNKMKLKLPPKELRGFGVLIGKIITSIDVRDLKAERHVDYLLFVCVSDLVDRIIERTNDFARYGAPVKLLKDGSVKPVRLSVTVYRHEALALFFILSEESGYDLSADPITKLVVGEVIALIHKNYMI